MREVAATILPSADGRPFSAGGEAIVRIAAGLRLEVVAEGIETRAQMAILDAMGCRRGQGILCSPAEASALLNLAAAPDAAGARRR